MRSARKYGRKPAPPVKSADRKGRSPRCSQRAPHLMVSSLPMPTRDEILNSPVADQAPTNGATSHYTGAAGEARPGSPIMDDPSAELERELASTHIARR